MRVSSIEEKKKKKKREIDYSSREPRVPIFRRHRLYLPRNSVLFSSLATFPSPPRDSCKRIERINDSGDCIPALQHVFYSEVIVRYICPSYIFHTHISAYDCHFHRTFSVHFHSILTAYPATNWRFSIRPPPPPLLILSH